MSAAELLALLHDKGVCVSVVDDQLRCRAPKGVLTPQICEWIAEQKKELLIVLCAGPNTSKPTILPSHPNRIVIGGRDAKQVFFENTVDACFRDTTDRFWHFNFAKSELAELIPKECDPETPIPQEIWEVYGTLIGLMILKRQKQTTNLKQKEDV
jgi:hypothetical protein